MVSALALACSSGGELPANALDPDPRRDVDPGTIRLPFLVEDTFVPNGCFGDRNCVGVLVRDARACTELPLTMQGACTLFTYAPLSPTEKDFQGFGGVLFQDVPGPEGKSGIGYVPGRKIEPGARRVALWAKMRSGSAVVTFRAGGANYWNDNEPNPALPYKDDFKVRLDVNLTDEYQEISLDMSGVSYDTVVSPFGWSIESQGRTEPFELFIGDVRWE